MQIMYTHWVPLWWLLAWIIIAWWCLAFVFLTSLCQCLRPQTYVGSSWASFQTLQTDKARCPEGIGQRDTNAQFRARRLIVIRSNPSMRTRGVQVLFFLWVLNGLFVQVYKCASRLKSISSPQDMPNTLPSRSSGRLFCEDGATACSRHVSRWSAWSWGFACSRLGNEAEKSMEMSCQRSCANLATSLYWTLL